MRMMKGTVVPVCVCVVVVSPGGCFGSHDRKPELEVMHLYLKVVALSHFALFDLFWQTHGLTCGPEKTGPPLAWSMIVSLAVRRPGAEAVSLFLPTFRPVTRPSNKWVGRILNSPVMLCPRRRTVTFEALRPLGRRMATSASPPEITSARSERTSMRGPGFSFAACAAAGRATANAAAPTATTSSVNRLRIAPRPCIEEGRPARTGRA